MIQTLPKSEFSKFQDRFESILSHEIDQKPFKIVSKLNLTPKRLLEPAPQGMGRQSLSRAAETPLVIHPITRTSNPIIIMLAFMIDLCQSQSA